MTRFRFVLLIVFSFTWFNAVAQEADYFPMQIGNKWVHELWTAGGPSIGFKWGTRITEITDTTTIDEKTYFVFLTTTIDLVYQPGNRTQVVEYYRKQENGDISKIADQINDEQLFYSIGRDSVYLFCGDIEEPKKWQITSNSAPLGINIPLGQFSNCFEFYFDIWENGTVLSLASRTLAPNIGLIQDGAEGDVNFLIGAYIQNQLLGDTTVTSVKSPPVLPSRATLFQNYPNPFNPITEIRYDIPKNGYVILNIYNIQGKKIRSLIENYFTAGSYRVTWDGLDYSGKRVASGNYFYKINIEFNTGSPFIEIKKLTFLR